MKSAIATAFALLLCSPAWAQGGPVGVIVAPASQSPLHDRHEVLADVLANEAIVVTSSVDDTVDRILFAEGERVTAGQVLLELTQAEEQAAWQAAVARQQEKRSALARVQEMQAQNLASAAELDLARAAMLAAEAEARARRAELDDRTIRAPFAGVLGIREVSPGAYLRAGDAITTLHDVSRLKLEFTVPQDWLDRLDEGLTLTARRPGTTQAVPVELLSQAVALDAATRSLRLRARLDPAALAARPGQLVLVELRSRARQALMVPEAALVPGQKDQRVYRIEDGRAVARTVVVGARRRGTVEIVEGLAAGDRVVVHGGIKLRPGAPVKVLAEFDGSVPIAELIRQSGP